MSVSEVVLGIVVLAILFFFPGLNFVSFLRKNKGDPVERDAE